MKLSKEVCAKPLCGMKVKDRLKDRQLVFLSLYSLCLGSRAADSADG
jgi:hypothetical protein